METQEKSHQSSGPSAMKIILLTCIPALGFAIVAERNGWTIADAFNLRAKHAHILQGEAPAPILAPAQWKQAIFIPQTAEP